MFQKYRDPLHILLGYIAEASTTRLVFTFNAHNTPNLT